MRDAKWTLSNRSMRIASGVKHSVSDASMSVRSGARNQVSKVQESMRTSPMKWAGIAAGTGLVLGLAGRLMQKRASRIPDLVIIESSC